MISAGLLGVSSAVTAGGVAAAALPTPVPLFSDAQLISSSTTPPTEAQCNSVGRRCFTPQEIQAAYNVGPLYAQNITGHGFTIALFESYGNDNMANDLHVFDQAFGLAPLCGEATVACAPGMPTFTQLALQGTPATKAPPSTSKSPGLEDKSAWALETALDVETAHAMAPGANILLVTTPTAETLGVQGFPQLMAAEAYVVKHHLADVISQSFGAAEESFGSATALKQLRYAFTAANAAGVTVIASSGDDGSAGVLKQPVSTGGKLLPNPAVQWPASDPLVTGVGGTYLCTSTDPNVTTRVVDSASPPVNCQANPGQAEIGWIDAGGGYSHVFSRPAYQNTLPAGSTPIPAGQRGVPDVALQASARTGALMYVSLPPDGTSGLICGTAPCSTGWYDIGGTSLSAPQWAGIVALADQVHGGDVGLINPKLYQIAAGPAYSSDFYDVTVGNNGAFAPTVPGFVASPGWDPVTGLGTPNVANLVPALAS